MQPLTLESILPHLWISGRSSRQEWWRVHIICAVFATLFDQMFIARLERGFGGLDDASVTVLWLAISAIIGWISFASVVRRLRDRGKSHWWALLYLLPGIGWLWLIIECGFLPSRGPALAAATAPVFTPQAQPSRPRPASRKPLSTAPRIGTIRRVEYRPWTAARAMKLAGNTIGVILLGLALYKWFFDTGSMAVFRSEPQQPAALERAD